MVVRDLSQYSISFQEGTTRTSHLNELGRLKDAVYRGPVTVDGELISDHTTSNTYLHIVSWEPLSMVSNPRIGSAWRD
jgi:hypothetical protein